MKLIRFIAVLAVALTALSATVAGAAPTQTATAAASKFEGTVVSVNRDARTFRLSDVERGTVRIKVTRNTRFERIDGFAGLKAGAKNIEATVKRKNGALVALTVERSGGGGQHGGGRDDRGGGGGGGNDDPAGDDHGGNRS
ncbi:MAG: hypothetical protein QOD71_3076 [Thermoleophilaceae bacterium]|jgi:uncharacterized membrane protein YgcG|nr:hypothetical protein [Thermoleophilaceae bacterium]